MLANTRQPLKLEPLYYLAAGLPWLLTWIEHGAWPSGIDTLSPAVFSVGIFLCIRSLLTQRRKIQALQTEREHLSATDPLTALGNSSALEDALVREVARAKRTGHPLCCLFFDVNNFKSINDQYGHSAGNLVLQTIGEVIIKSIRKQLDTAFRYGGDEFLILLPETDKAHALSIAQRLRESLSKTGPPLVPARKITFSIGVAKLTESQRAADLLAVVDRSIHLPGAKGISAIFDADDPNTAEHSAPSGPDRL